MWRKLLVIATVLAVVMFLSLQQASSAEAAPKTQQIAGNGSAEFHLHPRGPDIRILEFQFHAKEDVRGEVKGTARFDITDRYRDLFNPGAFFDNHYDFDVAINCLRVEGNSAILGGIVTRKSNSFFGPQIGQEVNWQVFDNGKAAVGSDTIGLVHTATPFAFPYLQIGGCIIIIANYPPFVDLAQIRPVDGHIRID
jgi:hypothetical protein